MCHCIACQRRTGSAFGLQARWPKERVEVTGRSTEYVRISDELRKNSAGQWQVTSSLPAVYYLAIQLKIA